jgi:hypothetical protein
MKTNTALPILCERGHCAGTAVATVSVTPLGEETKPTRAEHLCFRHATEMAKAMKPPKAKYKAMEITWKR